MLGKLIKHEWLSTWKVPTALCIYLGVFTILGCISFLFPVWESDNVIIELIAMLSVILYILSLFAITITVFVYFVVRFYKSMYTSEGYLTHSLPVRPWEHIFSKGLTFFIWMVITVIALTASVLLLILTALSSIDGQTIYMIWTSFKYEVLPEISTVWQELFGMSLGVYTLIILISCIISSVYAILMIYLSISIGQLFNKHKLMASFVAYAIINCIMQLLASLLQLPIYKIAAADILTAGSTAPDMFRYMLLSSLALSVVLTVVYAFATEYITRKKLNLD